MTQPAYELGEEPCMRELAEFFRRLFHIRLHCDCRRCRPEGAVLLVTVTARHHHRFYTFGEHPMTQSVTVAVGNAEGVAIPGLTPTAPVTYTVSSGTVTVSADTLSATVDGAALGTLTVTVTDAAGLTGTGSFDVVDSTPTQLLVTVS